MKVKIYELPGAIKYAAKDPRCRYRTVPKQPDATGRSHYHHREPLFSPQRNLLLRLYSDYCKPELANGSGIGSKILRLATREARAGGFVEYDGKRPGQLTPKNSDVNPVGGVTTNSAQRSEVG